MVEEAVEQVEVVKTQIIRVNPEGVSLNNVYMIAGISPITFSREIMPQLTAPLDSQPQTTVSIEVLKEICKLTDKLRDKNPVNRRKKPVIVEYQLPDQILLHFYRPLQVNSPDNNLP